MNDYILTLDLGTTNIKTCIYNAVMNEIHSISLPVHYSTDRDFVEFDLQDFWDTCKKSIKTVIDESGVDKKHITALSLTGQAESLVVLGGDGVPLRNGISWMDNRAVVECDMLKKRLSLDAGYRVTGQPDIIPTWPITKILWLKKNEKETFDKAETYLLIKDFIIFKLTGKLLSEYTVYNFSYYLDIQSKSYWDEVLDFAGVLNTQLPELLEPGSSAGTLLQETAKELGFSDTVRVNVGALDHFAGMIGSGNVQEGLISETTGTVLAIATLSDVPIMNEFRVPCQYSALKDRYVLMPVCESGGVCLEWFKRNFYPGHTFNDLNREVAELMDKLPEVIFLPYITGTNAPEYDSHAKGVFYGLSLHHTRADLARAVMEGVAYLLKKNVEHLEKMLGPVNRLISLGGASKSDIWNRIKADVTGKEILIPEPEEATSLGAGILAAVDLGLYPTVEDAVGKCVRVKNAYEPKYKKYYVIGYKRFLQIYDRLIPVFRNDIPIE